MAIATKVKNQPDLFLITYLKCKFLEIKSIVIHSAIDDSHHILLEDECEITIPRVTMDLETFELTVKAELLLHKEKCKKKVP